jgi:Tol biopolymer transport system component
LLSGAEGFNAYPAVSPDGRSVAFVSDRDRLPSLPAWCDCGEAVYVMRLDGSGVRRLSAPPPAAAVPIGWRLSDLVWSPDGRSIYFRAYLVVNPTGDPRSNHDSVWRVSSGGGTPELVDDLGGAFSLSRDGRYISIARLFYGVGELRVI